MPLVDMKDMLRHAYDNRYAIGAFDLVSLEFLGGILDAAEATRAPVILSLAESHFDYFDFDTIMPAVEAAAKAASVPVAIHLDHAESFASAVHGINKGCTGVMVDASHEPLDENIALSKKVVEMAHGCGVPVEGELGYVPGVEGEDAERHPGEVQYTTVADAKRYVEETGVDFLAVSIGTVHGRMKGEPKLDFERLAEINQALGLPLVIHGGTGLADDQYTKLIANGVTKINYYTALNDAAGRVMAGHQNARSFTDFTKGARAAIAQECEKRIKQWGAAGQAEAVLKAARPWVEVEHVIVFNVPEQALDRIHDIMAEGRKVLSQIPGVRRVFTGEAVKQGADYRFSWLIRFASEAVIASYRDHPDHVAFADNLFRPIAGGRISIDYADLSVGADGGQAAQRGQAAE